MPTGGRSGSLRADGGVFSRPASGRGRCGQGSGEVFRYPWLSSAGSRSIRRSPCHRPDQGQPPLEGRGAGWASINDVYAEVAESASPRQAPGMPVACQPGPGTREVDAVLA